VKVDPTLWARLDRAIDAAEIDRDVVQLCVAAIRVYVCELETALETEQERANELQNLLTDCGEKLQDALGVDGTPTLHDTSI
jgi:hypothetical protein